MIVDRNLDADYMSFNPSLEVLAIFNPTTYAIYINASVSILLLRFPHGFEQLDSLAYTAFQSFS